MSSSTTINPATEARPPEPVPAPSTDVRDADEVLPALLARLLEVPGAVAAHDQQTLHRALCAALKSPRVRAAIASELLSQVSPEVKDADEYEVKITDDDIPEPLVVDAATLARVRLIASTPMAEPDYPDVVVEYDYDD